MTGNLILDVFLVCVAITVFSWCADIVKANIRNTQTGSGGWRDSTLWITFSTLAGIFIGFFGTLWLIWTLIKMVIK